MLSNEMKQSVTKRAMPAPGGKALKEAIILLSNEMKQSVTKRAMPAPRGEGLLKGNHFDCKRNETVRYEAPEGRYLKMRRRIKPTKNATIAETTDFITSNALSRLLFSFSRG